MLLSLLPWPVSPFSFCRILNYFPSVFSSYNHPRLVSVLPPQMHIHSLYLSILLLLPPLLPLLQTNGASLLCNMFEPLVYGTNLHGLQ